MNFKKAMILVLAPMAIVVPLVGCGDDSQASDPTKDPYFSYYSSAYYANQGMIDHSDDFLNLSFPQSTLIFSDFEEFTSSAFEKGELIQNNTDIGSLNMAFEIAEEL